MSDKRRAFFISDGTGITAENVGRSLITQFHGIEFEEFSLPYVDTIEKALKAVDMVNISVANGEDPIIISTIVNRGIRDTIAKSNVFMLDTFDKFMKPLEHHLHTRSDHMSGRSHTISDEAKYHDRIAAVHFALDNDDGAQIKNYGEADLILVGVSRCGKTPTCLYLALQYGLKMANYPITEDDEANFKLPEPLREHRSKLFGLTIEPTRLSAIRNERRPNSRYSSLRQCADEVRMVEAMLSKYRIPNIDTTQYSIEEISTRILASMGIKRKML